jgi:PAS domain S-box-containing protein
VAQKFKDDDKRIMAAKKQTVIEESIIDAKKNTVWLETVKSPILDASGNVTGTVGIARNITERKKIEAALRQSGERFKQVAENAGEWIWEINAEGLYTYSNHIIEELLGYKVQEVVGKKHFYDFFAPDIREEFKKAALEAFERRESFRNFVNRNIHKNGSTVIFETNGTPIVDDKGNLCGYSGADRDITDRKLSEQKQAQLVQQLESVNKELRDFAYIVSHDLKAPLRAVKVLVDWLSTDYADKLDEDGKEQMTLLTKRVDRMHNLIDGIMQYSRISRVKEQNVKVDLNELVPEVIDLLAPPANITITTQANLPTVLCDKTRISQVFQNLLSNAVKSMDKPNGQVEVACVEENGFWKFSVADNGPGIEEQYFEKIFQMFQTLASRDDYESTGVGLTIAKKIVEMYGGKIWVESKVGHGSTFFFTLPKQQSEVKDEKHQACIVN